MNLSGIFNVAKVFAGQHAPEIYMGMGIGLSVLTPVLAAKETKDMLLDDGWTKEPTLKDKLVIYAKHYWPAAVTGTASIFLIVSGQHIQYKRTAAATAAYVLAQDSLSNFTEHVVSEIGPKKVTAIKDQITKEKIEELDFSDASIINTGNGDMLCYDAIGGRPFLSSVEAIRKAESEMNKRMLTCNFISLNEFYRELDLPEIKFGDELGWDVALEGTVDIEFSSQLYKNEKPCLVIDSDMCPRWRLYA